MEFTMAALAAAGAGFITNPLEVIKTRFQLQGELRKRGQYTVHYKNFLHAGYIIAKTDGITALQKGLAPTLFHQILLNGTRLSGIQYAEEKKWHLKANGEVSLPKTVVISGTMAVIGSYAGSPLYLVKTRLQAQSAESIAVGTQHHVKGIWDCFRQVVRTEGYRGLWRGVVGSVPRVIVGSSSQITTFFLAKEYLANNPYYVIERGLLNTTIASCLGGIVIAINMGPFDTISTRLYNQGVDAQGRGLLYDGYMDCVKKMWRTEGFAGFYKGIVPCFMRMGPHTVLILVFWDELRKLNRKYLQRDHETPQGISTV